MGRSHERKRPSPRTVNCQNWQIREKDGDCTDGVRFAAIFTSGLFNRLFFCPLVILLLEVDTTSKVIAIIPTVLQRNTLTSHVIRGPFAATMKTYG